MIQIKNNLKPVMFSDLSTSLDQFSEELKFIEEKPPSTYLGKVFCWLKRNVLFEKDPRTLKIDTFFNEMNKKIEIKEKQSLFFRFIHWIKEVLFGSDHVCRQIANKIFILWKEENLANEEIGQSLCFLNKMKVYALPKDRIYIEQKIEEKKNSLAENIFSDERETAIKRQFNFDEALLTSPPPSPQLIEGDSKEEHKVKNEEAESLEMPNPPPTLKQPSKPQPTPPAPEMTPPSLPITPSSLLVITSQETTSKFNEIKEIKKAFGSKNPVVQKAKDEDEDEENSIEEESLSNDTTIKRSSSCSETTETKKEVFSNLVEGLQNRKIPISPRVEQDYKNRLKSKQSSEWDAKPKPNPKPSAASLKKSDNEEVDHGKDKRKFVFNTSSPFPDEISKESANQDKIN